MRASTRLKYVMEEMAVNYPGAGGCHLMVRVNKRPSLGFSYTFEEDVLRVDISDLLLENSPDDVLRAISHIVLLGAFRDAYSSVKRRIVDAHIRKTESDDRVIRELLSRDVRIDSKLVGRRHHLKERFDAVNAEHFQGEVPPLNLAWSKKVEKRRWGYCVRERNLIVVNKQLDGPRVPRYVVDYILYHEMLHIVHKGLYSQFGREDHYVAFNLDEKKYPDYERAEKWLKNNG